MVEFQEITTAFFKIILPDVWGRVSVQNLQQVWKMNDYVWISSGIDPYPEVFGRALGKAQLSPEIRINLGHVRPNFCSKHDPHANCVAAS